MNFRAPVAEPLEPFGTDVPVGTFVVTRPFGDMSFPQYGPHDGLDIGNARTHDPVVAIEAGRVTYAGFDPNSGGAGIVRIDHGNGYGSGYAHLDRIDVALGQVVTKGQPLGILGSTGWVTAAHLHFGITVNGIPVDPWPLLNSAGGDDPVYNAPDLLSLYGLELKVKDGGANVRERQGTSYPIVTRLSPGTTIWATARVVGEAANGSIEWFETKVQMGTQVQTAFVHSSAVDLVPSPPSGGFTQAQVNAAKQTTADKANQQMDAWVATKPRIVP